MKILAISVFILLTGLVTACPVPQAHGQISGTISGGDASVYQSNEKVEDLTDLDADIEAARNRGDDQTTARLLAQACWAGQPEACFEAAELLQADADLDPNPYGAIAFYTRACDFDFAPACEQVRALFAETEANCAQNDVLACMASASFHLNNLTGIPYSPETAAQRFSAACARGHGPACTELGYLSAIGLGVDEDPARAATLFAQACTEAYAVECTRIGGVYLHGRPMAMNLDLAAAYFEKGCTFGDPYSCQTLGNAYLTGSFVETNLDRARTYLDSACEGGFLDACNVIPPLD